MMKSLVVAGAATLLLVAPPAQAVNLNAEPTPIPGADETWEYDHSFPVDVHPVIPSSADGRTLFPTVRFKCPEGVAYHTDFLVRQDRATEPETGYASTNTSGACTGKIQKVTATLVDQPDRAAFSKGATYVSISVAWQDSTRSVFGFEAGDDIAKIR